MYALVRQNTEVSLFFQMHQGYHKDADRLNSQLDLYAENPRYQNLFIDLVRSDTGKKKYTVFSPCSNIKSWGGVSQCQVYTSLIFRPHSKVKFKLVKTRTLLTLASPACLDLRQEMWRRLILHETGFPRVKFFTSYFIDGRVFFRIFAFYMVFDDLYACINTRKSIREKLHHCQRAKT